MEGNEKILEKLIKEITGEPVAMQGPDTSSIPDPYEKENWMDFEMFKNTVNSYVENAPKCWRKGQAVFNIIDDIFGVSRIVQFERGVDCFYNDDAIDDFMKNAYEVYWENVIKQEINKD